MSQSCSQYGFKIEVNTDHEACRVSDKAELAYEPGYTVLTTHNGYQWSGLSTMTMDELEVFHAYITDYLRENKR